MSAGPACVECRDLAVGRARADGARPVAVSGVSFRVAPGGRLLLAGPSGSGKTSLLRALCRLDDPLEGEVLVEGRPQRELDPRELRRRLAFVAARAVPLADTVREDLGTGRPAPDAALARALADVGLAEGFLARRTRELSAGELQRVALARALVGEPRALLLDEPTAALDAANLARVAEALLELAARRGVALIVATHQEEMLARLGGDRLWLEGGRARAGTSGVAPAAPGDG